MKNFNKNLKTDHKHKKKYGQNFLNDLTLLDKIRDVTQVNEKDNIIEIGVGQGYLTEMLIDNSEFVTAFEIDDDLIPYLNNKFSNRNNFKLFHEDFMKSDLENIIDKKKKYKVVANIPYYITSPIIEKLLEYRIYIDSIYIMVQKEVGNRICASKKTKDMSSFTHFINFYADTNYLFTVGKELFTPIPKVDSAFIEIKIKKNNEFEKLIDENIYFEYIKLAFSSKRKTLTNNFKNIIKKDKLEEILIDKGFSIQVRPEELDILDFINIIKEIESNKDENK